ITLLIISFLAKQKIYQLTSSTNQLKDNIAEAKVAEEMLKQRKNHFVVSLMPGAIKTKDTTYWSQVCVSTSGSAISSQG
ncbi:Protein of unknown function, partial [Gryllus bimaculatus]